MYRKFLNARSPLRLLEKGLHGGLGKGNLGLEITVHGRAAHADPGLRAARARRQGFRRGLG